jgi:hypothetical protein
MCLIVRGRVENLLVLDLEYAEISNRDGFGIHTPKSVVYSFDHKRKRGRGIRATLETLDRDTMATVHFRLATHGNVNRDNAHPFDIGSNTFLMHNGMLRGAEYDCPDRRRSDTAILAASLVGKSSKERFAKLSELAISNRFCVLRGSKWRKFGQWFFDDATCTWHSNRLILPASFGKRDSACCDPRSWYNEPVSKKSKRLSSLDFTELQPQKLGFCEVCDTDLYADDAVAIVNGSTYCENCDPYFPEHPDTLNFEDFAGFHDPT